MGRQGLPLNSSDLSVRECPIIAPSFAHAPKDPVPDAISIDSFTSIILLEGLYLLLDEPKRRDIACLIDMKVLVDVDPDIARIKVAKRHLASGIETTLEDAIFRVNNNDALNGALIRAKLVSSANIFVTSIDENHT